MKRKIFVMIGLLAILLTLVMVVVAQNNNPQEYVDAIADIKNAQTAGFESEINEDILAEMAEHAASMDNGMSSDIQEYK